MNLSTVPYTTWAGGSAQVTYYEIVSEPVSFDIGEGHVELGGELVAMKGGKVYQVFGNDGIGPTFSGLWDGCTFHLVVRSWQ